MDFVKIIKTLRVTGPNVSLVSKILDIDEDLLHDFLGNIKNLQFTPITRIDSIDFSEEGYIRRSVKGNFGLITNGKYKVVEIRNYSGIAEEYNPINDSWNLTLETKADYIPILTSEFSRKEFLSVLKSLTLKEPLISLINCSAIKGFIIDYGRRDFYVDIFTFDKSILESLEYIPFIRVGLVLKDEDLYIYFVELYVPEKHFNFVISLVRELCGKMCRILISPDSFYFSRKII